MEVSGDGVGRVNLRAFEGQERLSICLFLGLWGESADTSQR